MSTLSLQVEHALFGAELPQIHFDPMDRLLIAQSRIEGIPLVTNDALIRQYDVETIW